jgi:uncharacterized membrane protein YtjA (UPF0391 family)
MTWVFLILAVIMGFFAFTGITSGFAGVATLLFWIFALVFLVTLFGRRLRRDPREHRGSDAVHRPH